MAFKPVDKVLQQALQKQALPKQALPMEKALPVRGKAAHETASSIGDKVPPPYQKTPPAKTGKASAQRPPGGHDHVDAINQVFAELQLAYHNQFHKAFAQEGSLALAKKYWLGCLGEFAPELILRAVRQVVKSQEFLPTVAAVVNACENAASLYGLPTAEAAYIEACRAPQPRQAQPWSHQAVYHAGAQIGWFELESLPQSEIFPLFRYHYEQLCQRVLRGEALDIAAPTPLPARSAAPLDAEENRARLAALRRRFDL